MRRQTVSWGLQRRFYLQASYQEYSTFCRSYFHFFRSGENRIRDVSGKYVLISCVGNLQDTGRRRICNSSMQRGNKNLCHGRDRHEKCTRGFWKDQERNSRRRRSEFLKRSRNINFVILDWFLSKNFGLIETKIDDIRKSALENWILQLMNSNDYCYWCFCLDRENRCRVFDWMNVWMICEMNHSLNCGYEIKWGHDPHF